jgi:DNA segregation ATPase FtsK/SpoIIIE-like protein
VKTYSAASGEVTRTIERMRKEWHPELENVSIHALFIYDMEDTSEQVLKHGGYPAAAVVRITPLRERALGVADAVITIDRAYWLSIKAQQCDALIDHELYHLDRAKDTDTNLPLFVTTCGLETVGISRLQTQLKIGYNRAARLMEALEAKGYVGPMLPQGGWPILGATAH